MTLALALQLMILGALMSIGFVAERALQRTDPRVRVPVVVRTLLTGLALGGPWIAADTGLVPAVAQIDRTLVTLAVALLSYVFVTWLVGVADDGRCGRPSSN